MTNASPRKARLRRIIRFVGFTVILLCVLRISFWHVENDIREAAYRHAFASLYHNRSTWKTSFIGVRYGCSVGSDPGISVLTTPFLLNRFKGCSPPVKPESECDYDTLEQVADRKTGKTGAVFYTGTIWWLSWDTVQVEAGYYEGSVSASGNIYTLKRKNGRWVVVNERMLFIS